MNDELEHKLKFIGMKNLLQNWEKYIKLGSNTNTSYPKFLKKIVDEEFAYKKEQVRSFRIRKATMENQYAIETFPFKLQPNINKKKLIDIYDSLNYMKENYNFVLMGPTGAGKTGLAESFLRHAINNDYKGKFIPFPDLMDQLTKSIADHTEKQVVGRFAGYQCLVIDELGYIEVDSAQIGLFFSLMQKRHKKKCTIITTNLGFAEWSTFLKNKHLAAALIDRLTEHCVVINMKKCRSIRKKHDPLNDK
jgi:DNA replication protein DnaC